MARKGERDDLPRCEELHKKRAPRHQPPPSSHRACPATTSLARTSRSRKPRRLLQR